MLLLKLNISAENSSVRKIETFSVHDCISEALARYPFVGKERELIYWKKGEQDFKVKGELLLVTHILFNLIKNALHHVIKVGKGAIEIRVEKGQPYNKLYFKDTGAGIPAEILPHIFERFFSKTPHGAGVGLSFCKAVMEGLKGKILCESQEGDYTLFTLHFPVVE
jgi:signal transduction histidine kinase